MPAVTCGAGKHRYDQTVQVSDLATLSCSGNAACRGRFGASAATALPVHDK